MRNRRQVRETLLAVGEGDAEVLVLKYLRGIYTAGNSGRTVTIKNASGKGALHVIDYASRVRGLAPYSEAAALCDSDTDWNQNTEALAKRKNITVLLSEPCLEHWLLAVAGIPAHGSTPQIKQLFIANFGAPAHTSGLYEANFPRTLLDGARDRVSTLNRILASMGV